jgi:hypothetical protein
MKQAMNLLIMSKLPPVSFKETFNEDGGEEEA